MYLKKIDKKRHVNLTRIILCLEVRELYTLYVYIYILLLNASA